MILFLYILVIHLLSGLKNAAYYTAKPIWKGWQYIATVAAAGAVMWYGWNLDKEWFWTFAIPATLVLYFLFLFYKVRTDLVHALENGWKYFFILVSFAVGDNLLLLIPAFVFANLIFNAPIHLDDSNSLVSNAKYEKIELAGKVYNKRRVGYVVEILFGGIWFLLYKTGWSITLQGLRTTIIELFK